MRKLFTVVVFIGVLSAIPQTSAAQTNGGGGVDNSRIILDVNVSGLEVALGSDRVFRSFFLATGEVGSAELFYRKPSRDFLPFLDFGAAYMVARRAGIGVTVSRTSQKSATRLQASIPDPILWNAPSGAVNEGGPGLEQRQTATHIYAAFVPVRTDRANVRLTLGPTWFSYSADMVSGFSYQHAPGESNVRSPVTITAVATERVKGGTLGFHVGGEAVWFLHRAVGVATGVRFSSGIATLSVEPFSKLVQEVRVGQTRGYVGLRFRFGR